MLLLSNNFSNTAIIYTFFQVSFGDIDKKNSFIYIPNFHSRLHNFKMTSKKISYIKRMLSYKIILTLISHRIDLI